MDLSTATMRAAVVSPDLARPPMTTALRPGGRLVVVGQMASRRATLDVHDVFWKQVDFFGSSMGSPDDIAALLAHVETAAGDPSSTPRST